jgi:cell shape-determining protein MreC
LAESLAARVDGLERQNQTLAGIRRAGLGDRGRLIPARIIAGDVSPWRESSLVTAGAWRGVRRGQPVVSRFFTVDAGSEVGVQDGMNVLASEMLVGVVERVASHTARVRALSDPATEMPVMLGRAAGDRFMMAPLRFWLVGMGDGVMEVRDVDHRHVADGAVLVGDVVMTVSDDPLTPPAIRIGTVASITSDPDNRLLDTLRLTPAIDPRYVASVYVVDTGAAH